MNGSGGEADFYAYIKKAVSTQKASQTADVRVVATVTLEFDVEGEEDETLAALQRMQHGSFVHFIVRQVPVVVEDQKGDANGDRPVADLL